MVADAECRTPTEAGTRVVPLKRDLLAALAERRRRLERETARQLAGHADRLAQRRQRLAQALPALLRRRSERLERFRSELARLSPGRQLERREELLRDRGARLEAAARRLLRQRRAELAGRDVATRLDRALAGRLAVAETGLGHRRRRLQALSPERVLGRGYSITLDEAGHVLRSAAGTAPGRAITVRLAAGSLAARVEETHE
jgi:exodeoxyribonuclease VII large subunit